MRKLTLLFIMLLFIIIIKTGFAQTDSILFIGNSYTYVEDIPGKFKSLAESAGKSVFIDSYTPGGQTLQAHYSDAQTIAKINAHQWKYVILQEQSQMPYLYPQTTQQYANMIAFQYIKANNPCTEVVMYMTWARQAGEAWLTTIGKTHDEMATYYENFYSNLWQYVPSRVSPVGAAFHIATNNGINIYSGDGSHQNADGAYLSACVFYATLYKESPVGLTFSSASSNTIKDQLQQIAHDVVMNNFDKYNINKVRWTMSTTNLLAGETVDFFEGTYMEPFPNKLEWTFEGATPANSLAENPSGIKYDIAGNFNVTLKITDDCGYTETRTFTDTIKVQLNVGTETIDKKSIQVYPTVLSSYNEAFQINGASDIELRQLKIYTMDGKELNYKINNQQISIQNIFSEIAIVSLPNYSSKIFIK